MIQPELRLLTKTAYDVKSGRITSSTTLGPERLACWYASAF